MGGVTQTQASIDIQLTVTTTCFLQNAIRGAYMGPYGDLQGHGQVFPEQNL